jgi:hypothetical protein
MSRFVFAVALAAALVLAVAATAGARSTAAAPVTFTDATGDAGSAADLTSVAVSNDTAGNYTFEIGFATTYVKPSAFQIFIDADKNASTGSPTGAEWVLGEWEDDAVWELAKWNGSDWAQVVGPPTVHVHLSADTKTLVFQIGKDDLGGLTSFDFYVMSDRSDNDDVDDGPSGSGTWEYTYKNPVSLVAAGARASTAKAGGQWLLALLARRSDTGDYLAGEGTIVCTANAPGTKLKLVSRAFISGGGGAGTGAVCSFAVPKKLKHKKLTGTIAVSYEGSTVTKSFSTTAK